MAHPATTLEAPALEQRQLPAAKAENAEEYGNAEGNNVGPDSRFFLLFHALSCTLSNSSTVSVRDQPQQAQGAFPFLFGGLQNLQ